MPLILKDHWKILLSLLLMFMGIVIIYHSVEWGLLGAYQLFDFFDERNISIQDHTDKFVWFSMARYQVIGILVFLSGLITIRKAWD